MMMLVAVQTLPPPRFVDDELTAGLVNKDPAEYGDDIKDRHALWEGDFLRGKRSRHGLITHSVKIPNGTKGPSAAAEDQETPDCKV